MKNLIIIGAGGFGLEVAAYAEDAHRIDSSQPVVKGFLDDTKPQGAIHAGYPILGDTKTPVDKESVYLIALGFPQSRKIMHERFKSKGVQFHTLLHPQTYRAQTAIIGSGTITSPFAIIGPEANIGEQCLLNHFSSVGHEAQVGSHVVLCPHSSIHGEAQIGDDVFIGSGAYITARIRVGSRSKCSAGSVIYTDVPEDSLAIGNPAAFRKQEPSL